MEKNEFIIFCLKANHSLKSTKEENSSSQVSNCDWPKQNSRSVVEHDESAVQKKKFETPKAKQRWQRKKRT